MILRRTPSTGNDYIRDLSSKLIFPTASYTKNCTFEPVLDGEQGREVTRAFNAVVNG
jgi:hypothetical protein